MIVIVASRADGAAHRAAARWRSVPARLLTVDDLTSPGWRIYTDDPARSRAVVEGEVVATDDIKGVLTRAPAITERELPMLAAEDRQYAATEMTAFLVYWLSSLRCRVLNRPSAASLCGPTWRSEQWTLTAARLGLEAEPRHRHVRGFDEDAAAAPYRPAAPQRPAPDEFSVTVIGERCFGTDDGAVADHARALADAAGVEMLVVRFAGSRSEPRFVDAHRWVDLRDEALADALLAHLTSTTASAIA